MEGNEGRESEGVKIVIIRDRFCKFFGVVVFKLVCVVGGWDLKFWLWGWW